MADLDDFFAKKDKKKGSKGIVKNKTTPDELVRRIEENKKSDINTITTSGNNTTSNTPGGNTGNTNTISTPTVTKQPLYQHQLRQGDRDKEPIEELPVRHEDDEWKDFEIAKKDYTGLKIQNLALNSSNVPDNNSDYNAESDSNSAENRGKPAWNKTEASESPNEVIHERKEPERPAPSLSQGTSYVPPSLRHRPPGGVEVPVNRLRKPNAPDIHSEEFFPTLGGDGKRSTGNSGGAWTSAGGGRSAAAVTREAPREVLLGNRFTSLENNS